MVLDILFGIAIILTLTLGYTTYNQLQKVERLESWVEEFSQRVIDTQNVLDQLDSEVLDDTIEISSVSAL